ncbi:hypothetical protein JCM10908_001301 [Rhodotorula pacifica]|uniref:uncharacterized protein n=1 Tax=Rhodotorula pacifica TaxID=1495444 RepID=UPI003178817E
MNGPFVHVKFGAGRPPPHDSSSSDDTSPSLAFAHQIESDPSAYAQRLHDSLKTDVQRQGVVRWLEQNFKEGSFIYDVVHRRERDEGMFALVTRNWARSVGDPKLHLSLYIYQDHMHVATWHAYSDRSVSYSRTGDENDPPPDGSDPYSTPEAIDRGGTPAPPSSLKDDGRPRFDRPAAAPESGESELEDAEEVPFTVEEVVKPPTGAASVSSRAARKPKPAAVVPEDGSSEEEQGPQEPSKKRATSQSRAEPSGSESERSPSPAPPPAKPSRSTRRQPPEPASPDSSRPAYPIVKSQPLGKSRSVPVDEEESRSRSPSPRPKAKTERGRDRTPVSPSRSPPVSKVRADIEEKENVVDRQRERSRRRARPVTSEPTPSPSRSRSRSPSPAPAATTRADRGRRTKRAPSPASEEGSKPVKAPVAAKRDRSARRPKPPSPSPSRSPSPEPEPKKASVLAAESKKSSQKEEQPRSPSRSPSPVRQPKSRSSRSAKHEPEVEAPQTEDERSRRGRSRAPVVAAPPQLDRTPSWRSVSRNRHRRNGSDSSGDDTLVRGNLVDADLDIPAGGEATLLTAKRRASISERSARRPPRPRDDSFDPEVVQKPPPVESPKQQTATAVLGSWIKSVGTLLKQEPQEGVDVDFDADEEEERRQRKAERAKRRAARAARRAARETEAQSTREDVDSEPECRPSRSSRRPDESATQSRRASRARSPSPSPPPSPVKPARPALRERAMSVSATIDSGFKNLRDSVSKMVSGVSEPASSSGEEDREEDRARRHRQRSRSRRRVADDESEPEEAVPPSREARELEDNTRNASKPVDFADSSRRRDRSRRRERVPNSDTEPAEAEKSRTRLSHSSRPATGAAGPAGEPALNHRDKEDAAPSSRSTRSTRQPEIDRDHRPAESRSVTTHAEIPDERVRLSGNHSPLDETAARRSRQPDSRHSRASAAAPPLAERSSQVRMPAFDDAGTSSRDGARLANARNDESASSSRPSTAGQSRRTREPPRPSRQDDRSRTVESPNQFARAARSRPPSPPSPPMPKPSISAVKPRITRQERDGVNARHDSLDIRSDDEARFDARTASAPAPTSTRPSSSRASQRSEYIPPIPARVPTSRKTPVYDSAPLRPEPKRAQSKRLDYASDSDGLDSEDSRRFGPYDSGSSGPGASLGSSSAQSATQRSQNPERNLPRAASFSRSQPAFYPSSDGADSRDDDNDALSTSEPDSVAFGRGFASASGLERDYRSGGRGNGYSGGNRYHGSATSADAGRTPLPDARSARGHHSEEENFDSPYRQSDFSSARSSLAGFSSSGAASFKRSDLAPPSSTSRTTVGPPSASIKPGDPSRSSRTMVSSRPSSTAHGATSALSSTSGRHVPPYVSERSAPSYSYGDEQKFDRSSYRDRSSYLNSDATAYSDTRPPFSDAYSDAYSLQPSLSASGMPTRDSPTTNSSGFERSIAKGRESGSVQLFGKHGAPVSRRTARRLGMS